MDSSQYYSNPGFKGYSIKEIKERKVMLLLQRELLQERLKNHITDTRGRFSIGGIMNDKERSGVSKAVAVTKSILGNSALLRYITGGVALIGAARTVSGWFKKKKKTEL